MNILYLVSWFAASFSSTHSLRETPGEWARHGLHCCPIGIWSINFPPEATLPPAGPPVGLLFSTEQLMMDFGRSVFFCTIEADELLLLLLLSAEHPVSNSVKASRWDTIFSESKHDFTGVTRRDKHVDLPSLFWVPSTSTSPSSLIGSLWRRHPHHCTELAKECEEHIFSYLSSCSSVMHFSYTGPCISLWLGKILSCCRMMLFTRSLIRACRVTASSSWAPLTRLGPKHTARL